ncbi:MAG: hypothetical protein ACP5KJ_00850 [Candidatus Micrarchaeia archaeon]
MIKKREAVYREMLTAALLEKRFTFTQLGLSKKFGFSLSTIHNALRPLVGIGAIGKRTRSFEIIDTRKVLMYWATARKLQRDIIYTTRVEGPVARIEGNMPAGAIFTAYSGYRILYKDAPADYSEVYVYADAKALEEIRERFAEKSGPQNLFVLEKDPYMPEKPVAPLPQIYVDLWNLREWYAKDFLDALEKRMFG